jgi:hypothetical protein
MVCLVRRTSASQAARLMISVNEYLYMYVYVCYDGEWCPYRWICLFIYLFIYLFVYLFIYLFVCLFICPPDNNNNKMMMMIMSMNIYTCVTMVNNNMIHICYNGE